MDLDELRQRVARLEGRPSSEPLATHPALEGLVSLRAGGVYGVDSGSLLTTLLAGPSGEGRWCGLVGAADLGLEAAAESGLDLSRTVLVPEPGPDWFDVVAALVDVLTVVAVRPPAGRRGPAVSERDATRLAARLRTRAGVLVVWGEWPRCDARLRLVEGTWSGLGRGHGHLQARRAVVEVRRGTSPGRRATLWLPDAAHRVRPVEAEPVALPMRNVS